MIPFSQEFKTFGDAPQPCYGHTMIKVTNQRACLFGGGNQLFKQGSLLKLNDSVYVLNLQTFFWKKFKNIGDVPSPRAAHAVTSLFQNKIVMYGGVTANGGMASKDLYFLQLSDDSNITANWTILSIKGKRPEGRYGHTLTSLLVNGKIFLVLFGGCNGSQQLNDCWIMEFSQKNTQFEWQELQFAGLIPEARVYHSASVYQNNLLILYGGRSSQGKQLKDCWGLRKKKSGQWKWQITTQNKQNSNGRFQHTSHVFEDKLYIIGGNCASTKKTLPIMIFNLETGQWKSIQINYSPVRHSSIIYQNKIFTFGGILGSGSFIINSKLTSLNIDLSKGSVIKDFSQSYQKSMQSHNTTCDASDTQSNYGFKMKIQSKNEKINFKKISQGPEISNQLFKKNKHQSDESPILPKGLISNKTPQRKQKSQKKKVVINTPIVGQIKNQKLNQINLKRQVKSTQDIPHYFLNILLQPKNFINSNAIKLNWNSTNIINYLHILCDIVQQIFKKSPIVQKIRAPVKIFGDIHGQFSDFMSFFYLYGTPHENGIAKDIQGFDYLFLGDYVDRGCHSLQTICLLFALKTVYPDQVHLLRGNHQDVQINSIMGFRQQCKRKLKDSDILFYKINKVFEYMPLAALIQDQILCVHGGIGAGLNTIKDIQSIKRPLVISHQIDFESEDKTDQFVMDILWSDPTQSDSILGIHPNYERDINGAGGIVKFGPDRVQDFLAFNNLSMIIRAHQCVQQGFERFAEGKLITLFSATDYCRKHKNAGAILIITNNLEIAPKLIYPSSSNNENWIEDEDQLAKRPPTPPRWKNQVKKV